MKKTVSAMMLTLLILSMLTLAFNVRPVEAWGKCRLTVIDDSFNDP